MIFGTSEAALRRGSGGTRLSIEYMFGMLSIYIGERFALATDTARYAYLAVGAAGILIAIIGRVIRLRKIDKAAKPIERRILFCYLAGVAALAIYGLQSDWMMAALRDSFSEPRTADRYRGVMATLWVIVWLAGVLPLLFLEITYGPMDAKHTVDLRRAKLSVRAGMTIAFFTCSVFLLNFVFADLNKKFDLSYFKTSKPSDSSKKMVSALTTEMKITLFYPGANEVLGHVRSYFDELADASAKVKVRLVDHALEPKLAKDLGVSRNGTVVFSRKGQNHQYQIGTKLGRAKSKLKKLDQEFQRGFLKISKGQSVAYFSTGHGERSRSNRPGTKGTGISEMRKKLQSLNYKVKDLPPTDLLSQVPDDAALLIVAGPLKDFDPVEAKSVSKYLAGGGRALILLDPETGKSFRNLLGPLGLRFAATIVAHDRIYYPSSRTIADRHLILTNRFGAHPTVSALSRQANKKPLLMFRAGFITQEKTPEQLAGDLKTVFAVHGMPGSWADINRNFRADTGIEKRGTFEFGAAISLRLEGASKRKDNKPDGLKSTDENEMRAFVLTDSHALADGLFRSPFGNADLFDAVVKWLGGQEKFIGQANSERDKPIQHSRKEDQIWFYLTIFLMPSVVLAAGGFYTRRRRKRRARPPVDSAAAGGAA